MFPKSMTLEEIKAAGGYLAREHFPFGRCDAYKLPDLTWRYQRGDGSGTYVTFDILAADLRETWQPVAQEDRSWYRLNVAL
jgi:hypothetical protein